MLTLLMGFLIVMFLYYVGYYLFYGIVFVTVIRFLKSIFK